jgi:hypothetical protein
MISWLKNSDWSASTLVTRKITGSFTAHYTKTSTYAMKVNETDAHHSKHRLSASLIVWMNTVVENE